MADEQQAEEQKAPTAAEQAVATTSGSKLPISVGQKGLDVKTLDDLWRVSTIFAKSELVPKDFRGKPENCFVALEMGMELGLPPMQALQNIAVINGRGGIYGDLGLALIQGSGLLDNIDEFTEGDYPKDTFQAVCVIRRRGHVGRRYEFSIGDAKTAGLWGKAGPWTTHPKRMLMWRARWYAMRDNFSDVLKGIPGAEELQDQEAIDVTPERTASPAEKSTEALREKLQEAQPPAKAAKKSKVDQRLIGDITNYVGHMESTEPGSGVAALKSCGAVAVEAEVTGETLPALLAELPPAKVDEAAKFLRVAALRQKERVEAAAKKPNGNDQPPAAQDDDDHCPDGPAGVHLEGCPSYQPPAPPTQPSGQAGFFDKRR